MTVLAIGTCLLIIPAGQTGWHGRRMLAPFLMLGRRSYEVYLTHMFVVFAFFNLFVAAGKPFWTVPALFLTVIIVSALLGSIVARFFSDPMNYKLRELSGSTS
jgi:peptidoglycan/LPS O-acetylase OafA/YrhL